MEWGRAKYAEYGLFSGQAVFLSERKGRTLDSGKGRTPARGKLIAGFVNGPLLEAMEQLVYRGCMDQGPNGRPLHRARCMRKLKKWLYKTIRRFNLPGYLGFEIRSHFLFVYLDFEEHEKEWKQPWVVMYGMQLKFESCKGNRGLFSSDLYGA